MEQPVEYEFSLKPDLDEELGKYVIGFEGVARCFDEQTGDERAVGELSGYRLDLASALYDGHSQGWLLDSVAPEISDFSQTVLADETCLLPESEVDGVGQEECECLVYVTAIRVAPGYRGRGIGSALLMEIGAMLDITNCMIALKAFPLSDDLGREVRQEEIERIKRFYLKHRFIHAGAEFMVKDARLCEAMKKRLARRRAGLANGQG